MGNANDGARDDAALTATRVTIDGVATFDALVDSSFTWNGWLAPWFTHAESLRIAAWLAETPAPEETQRLDFEQADIEVDPATHEINPLVAILSTDDEAIEQRSRVIDGVRYYAIGAFEWVWTEADNA